MSASNRKPDIKGTETVFCVSYRQDRKLHLQKEIPVWNRLHYQGPLELLLERENL
jgi:hypothetical protein